MKKKIAFFIGCYLPAKKYGGPVTSIYNVVDNLSDTYEFYIIASDHDLNETKRLPGIKEGWNKVGDAKVLYLKDSEFTKEKFTAVLNEIQADMVYLSSVFSYKMNFPAIQASRKLNIPMIFAPRGELCEGAIRIKTFRKRLFIYFERLIRIFHGIYFHATSQEEEQGIIKYLKIDKNLMFNISEMSCKVNLNNMRKKDGNTLKIIYMSRLVTKKNLLFAIQQTAKCKADIVFDIYGPIEDEEYWNNCKSELDKCPANVRAKYCGAVLPGEAVKTFSNYDVFLFPTLSENYGHIIAEALSTGCHIIISKETTPWDDVDGKGGFALPLDDTKVWSETIDMIANMTDAEYEKFNSLLREYVQNKLDNRKLKNSYIEMFTQVMG